MNPIPLNQLCEHIEESAVRTLRDLPMIRMMMQPNLSGEFVYVTRLDDGGFTVSPVITVDGPNVPIAVSDD